MIYLEKTTTVQMIYIPRNDGEGTVHKVYEEGYEDGKEYQKSLMSATTITENGSFSAENGYSEVTVNVPAPSIESEKQYSQNKAVILISPTSGYDAMASVRVDASLYGERMYNSGITEGYSSGRWQGYTEGLNDGVESGITHQKELMVSTAITENGTYTKEDGFSSVTVNVNTEVPKRMLYYTRDEGDIKIVANEGITRFTSGPYITKKDSIILYDNTVYTATTQILYVRDTDEQDDWFNVSATTDGYLIKCGDSDYESGITIELNENSRSGSTRKFIFIMGNDKLEVYFQDVSYALTFDLVDFKLSPLGNDENVIIGDEGLFMWDKTIGNYVLGTFVPD